MDSKTGRILPQQESSDGLGYYRVYIRNSNLSTKLEMVHRLVASAFVEGYQREKVVNHIDCNPSNNKASNLEWLTQTENLRHRSPETLFKKYKPVYSFDKQGRLERVYASQELTKKDGHYSNRVSSASKYNNVIHHNLYWGVVGDKLWETKYKDVFENDILYFLVDW